MLEAKIRNIGLIKEANIKLNGLSIIAGDNNTGKSTIGKSIYTSIKGLISPDSITDQFKESLFKKIEKIINDKNIAKKIENEKIDFDSYIENILSENLKKFIEETHKEISSLKEGEEQNKRLENYGTSLASFLIDEFSHQVVSFHSKEGTIALCEDDESIFSMKISKNKDDVNTNDCSINLNPLMSLAQKITDVTFIESPLYLNFYKLFSRTPTLSSSFEEIKKHNGIISHHTKDLCKKIEKGLDLQTIKSKKTGKIAEEIGFEFSDENGEKKFFLKISDEKKEVDMFNVASGIKTFAALDILEQGEYINEKQILILDEPEVHLHPEWQVKLAEHLVRLSKAGAKIVLTTHSPYILEAIRLISKIEESENITSFYQIISEKDGYYSAKEKTEDISELYKKFEAPLVKIQNKYSEFKARS